MSFQEGLEFDPERAPPLSAADTHQLSSSDPAIWLVGIAGIILIIATLTINRWMPRIKRVVKQAWQMHLTPRRRGGAALWLCLGLAIVLADQTFVNHLVSRKQSILFNLHRDGWIAFIGGVVSLVGIYHWIAGPPHDKI